MNGERNVELARRLFQAYADRDIAAIDALIADDVVWHVPGRHPLAGDHRGKAEVFGYLARVDGISESDDGGFAVHSVTGDADHAIALVTGTIEHGGRRFVRPTVCVVHADGERVTEFWEASLDQHAEDAFWVYATKE